MKIDGIPFDEYALKAISRHRCAGFGSDSSRELSVDYQNGSRPRYCIITVGIGVTGTGDDNSILFGTASALPITKYSRFQIDNHVDSLHAMTLYEWVEPNFYYRAEGLLVAGGAVVLVEWQEIDF